MEGTLFILYLKVKEVNDTVDHWFIVMKFKSNPSKKLHTAHYAESKSHAVLQAITYWKTRTNEELEVHSVEKLRKLSDIM